MKYTTQLFAMLLALLGIGTAAKAGYYPLKLVNNTANTTAGIHPYIIFMAQDTTAAANYCVLQLSYNATANAQVGSLVPITATTNSQSYTYRLDSLQGYDTATQSVVVLIPNTISGRCMVSLNYPLYLPAIPQVPGSSQYVFQNPSVSNTADVNYDIIYDKFEFTYNKKNVFYIDPTAVDFFSIPIGMQGAGTSGAAPNAVRSKLMATIQQVLGTGAGSVWDSLVIKDSATILRITAPNLAPAFSGGYLSQSSFNYIDSLVKYYQSHIVKINTAQLDVAGDEVFDKYNVTPAQDSGAYIFTGSPIVNGLWIFTNNPASGTPITDTIDMNTAVSNNFFGPGTPPFITPDKTVISIIVENIAAAFTVGLLPAPDSMTLDSNYLNRPAKYKYYKNNPYLNAPKGSGPWYNLYTQALHKAIPQIYAFAYDDVLGQSGTLVSSNNADTITVTLGDMGKITIPAHSGLLPVLPGTLVSNTGFTLVDSNYVDTLRWTMPQGQPSNAQYFFMGSGPDFTIPDSVFLSYQYGNFFSYADTVGWVSIPASLLSGNCTNLNIPMSVYTCGGPGNPCPTGSANWKNWMNATSSNLMPGVDSIVYPVTIQSYSALAQSGSNYTATVTWTVPGNQPSNAQYFFLAGGPGYIAPPDSMIVLQTGSLQRWDSTSATVTIPASLLDTANADSVSIQMFTCGGPGHPCPTAANLSYWTCDEGSAPVYPTAPAALQQRKKKKK